MKSHAEKNRKHSNENQMLISRLRFLNLKKKGKKETNWQLVLVIKVKIGF